MWSAGFPATRVDWFRVGRRRLRGSFLESMCRFWYSTSHALDTSREEVQGEPGSAERALGEVGPRSGDSGTGKNELPYAMCAARLVRCRCLERALAKRPLVRNRSLLAFQTSQLNDQASASVGDSRLLSCRSPWRSVVNVGVHVLAGWWMLDYLSVTFSQVCH